MIGLDVNASIVHAGMWPLFITLALIAFVVFLYRSMRKQVGRIDPDLPRAEPKDPFADDENADVEPMAHAAPPNLRHRDQPGQDVSSQDASRER